MDVRLGFFSGESICMSFEFVRFLPRDKWTFEMANSRTAFYVEYSKIYVHNQ